MRVAVVLHDLSPGGSERAALRLADEWAHDGIAVDLLLGAAEGVLAPSARLAVHALSPAIPRGPGSRLRLGYRLAALVDRLRPDILFLPGNWHLALARPLVAGLAGRRPRLVAKLSNPPLPRQLVLPARPFGAAIFRGLAAPVDAFAAWPPGAAARLKRLLPRTRIEPIPNPPFMAAELPAPRARSGRLLAAGRLVPQKGFDRAIAAMAHLPGLALDIAGEGPERPALERQIARLGLGERVRLLGHVPGLQALLSTADLLLLPSRFEGTPAVLLEALSAHVPVVATPCCELVEQLVGPPGTGEIVHDPRPARLAAAVRRQLDAPSVTPPTGFAAHAPAAVARRYRALFESLVADA